MALSIIEGCVCALPLTPRPVLQGHAAPTREDLEHADEGMAKPGKEAGPSGRPGDPYTQVRSQGPAETLAVTLLLDPC